MLYGQFLRNGVSSRDSGRGGNQTGEDSTDVVTDDPRVQSLTFFHDGKHLVSDVERSHSFVLPAG